MSTPDSGGDAILDRFFAELELADQTERDELLRQFEEQHPQRRAELQEVFRSFQLMGKQPRDGASDYDPLPPTFDDFVLECEIARGGMGVVYRARQKSLNRLVAIKTPLRNERLFENERQFLAAFYQTNLIPIFEYGAVDGQPYIVMPFIQGATLSNVVFAARRTFATGGKSKSSTIGKLVQDVERQAEPAPTVDPGDAAVPASQPIAAAAEIEPTASPSEFERTRPVAAAREDFDCREIPADYYTSVARCVRSIAIAVQRFHASMVHRDLKPDNVLVDRTGHPTIIDFGVAGKVATRPKSRPLADDELTADGMFGTPEYMAPEQMRFSYSRGTDIWGIGGILYELLTFQAPFAGVNRRDATEAAEHQPRSVATLNKHAPADLAAIAHRCLQFKRSDRYTAAQDVADELDRWLLDVPVMARQLTWWQRAGKWARRHPGRAASLVGLILLAAFSSGFGLWIREQNRVISQNRQTLKERNSRLVDTQIDLKGKNAALERTQGELTSTNTSLVSSQRKLGVALAESQQRERRIRAQQFALGLNEAFELWRNGSARPAADLMKRIQIPDDFTPASDPAYSLLQNALRAAQVYEANGFEPSAMAVAPGDRLFMGDDRGQLRLVNLSDGVEQYHAPAHDDPIRCLATDASGDRVVTIDDNGVCHVWDSRAGKIAVTVQTVFPNPRDLTVSGDGRLAVLNSQGRVLVASLDSGAVERILTNESGDDGQPAPNSETTTQESTQQPREPDRWTALAWNGTELLAGSQSGRILVWTDTADPPELYQQPDDGSAASIEALSCSPDRAWVATIQTDGSMSMWSAADRRQVHSAAAPDEAAGEQIAFLNNVELITRHASGRIFHRDLQLRTTHAVRGHDRGVERWAVGATSLWFVTASPEGTIRAWDLADERRVDVATNHFYKTKCVVSPDGQKLVTYTRNTSPKLWDATTGQFISKLGAEELNIDPETGKIRFRTTKGGHQQSVVFASFSRDNQCVATGSLDATARIWSAASGQEVATLRHSTGNVGFPTRPVLSVAFDPSNPDRVVTTTWDKRIRVWSIVEQEVVHEFKAHAARIPNAIFSDDGEFLVSASWDGSVKVWRTDDWSLVGQLPIPADSTVGGVAWHESSRQLATWDRSGSIQLWQLPDAGIAAVADSVPGRALIAHAFAVESIGFSENGDRLISITSGAHEQQLRIWDAGLGMQVGQIDGCTSFSISASANRLALAGEPRENFVKVHDLDVRAAKRPVELVEHRVTDGAKLGLLASFQAAQLPGADKPKKENGVFFVAVLSVPNRLLAPTDAAAKAIYARMEKSGQPVLGDSRRHLQLRVPARFQLTLKPQPDSDETVRDAVAIGDWPEQAYQRPSITAASADPFLDNERTVLGVAWELASNGEQERIVTIRVGDQEVALSQQQAENVSR